MQDRILGPLTMVQFIYAVIGGGLCYAIFSVVPKPFSFILIFPLALFTLAMIFLKVNERPFLDFLTSLAFYMSTPRNRVWKHENSSGLEVEIYEAKPQNTQNVASAKHFTKEQIQEAARRVDQL